MKRRALLDEWVDLSKSEDLRDLRDAVHRAVATLARGGLVALPTEGSYALAASALDEGAVARLAERTLEGGGPPRPLPICLRAPEELDDWAPWAGAIGGRMARRGWPGPLVLVFSERQRQGGLVERLPKGTQRLVVPRGELALRCPMHSFVQDVARMHMGPLVLGAGAYCDPEGRPRDPEFPGADLVCDEGPTDLQGRSTWAAVDDQGHTVRRPGLVDDEALWGLAAFRVLFVCTGNTCRSPMAQAILQARLANRLGRSVADLPKAGFLVQSAGVAAARGGAATPEAVEAVLSFGGDLQAHKSRPVTFQLVDQADLVLAMTQDHLDALLARCPEAAGKARLLRDDGRDVEDPYGGDQRLYGRTAALIDHWSARLLDDLGIGARP